MIYFIRVPVFEFHGGVFVSAQKSRTPKPCFNCFIYQYITTGVLSSMFS